MKKKTVFIIGAIIALAAIGSNEESIESTSEGIAITSTYTPTAETANSGVPDTLVPTVTNVPVLTVSSTPVPTNSSASQVKELEFYNEEKLENSITEYSMYSNPFYVKSLEKILNPVNELISSANENNEFYVINLLDFLKENKIVSEKFIKSLKKLRSNFHITSIKFIITNLDARETVRYNNHNGRS